jgi:hypothetical protein
MQRTYVMQNPIQYTPGLPDVMIPAQSVIPPIGRLEHIDTTQDTLTTSAGNWGDDEVKAALLAELQARYVGDTVEVLFVSEWQARQAAEAEQTS